MAWVKLEMMGACWVGESSADAGSATEQIEPKINVLFPVLTQAERHLFKVRGDGRRSGSDACFLWAGLKYYAIVEFSIFCSHLSLDRGERRG